MRHTNCGWQGFTFVGAIDSTFDHVDAYLAVGFQRPRGRREVKYGRNLVHSRCPSRRILAGRGPIFAIFPHLQILHT